MVEGAFGNAAGTAATDDQITFQRINLTITAGLVPGQTYTVTGRGGITQRRGGAEAGGRGLWSGGSDRTGSDPHPDPRPLASAPPCLLFSLLPRRRWEG
jgi:hypothetical protein